VIVCASLPAQSISCSLKVSVSSQCRQNVSYARVILFGQVRELFLSTTKDEDFVIQLRALDLFDRLSEWNGLVV